MRLRLLSAVPRHSARKRSPEGRKAHSPAFVGRRHRHCASGALLCVVWCPRIDGFAFPRSPVRGRWGHAQLMIAVWPSGVARFDRRNSKKRGGSRGGVLETGDLPVIPIHPCLIHYSRCWMAATCFSPLAEHWLGIHQCYCAWERELEGSIDLTISLCLSFLTYPMRPALFTNTASSGPFLSIRNPAFQFSTTKSRGQYIVITSSSFA